MVDSKGSEAFYGDESGQSKENIQAETERHLTDLRDEMSYFVGDQQQDKEVNDKEREVQEKAKKTKVDVAALNAALTLELLQKNVSMQSLALRGLRPQEISALYDQLFKISAMIREAEPQFFRLSRLLELNADFSTPISPALQNILRRQVMDDPDFQGWLSMRVALYEASTQRRQFYASIEKINKQSVAAFAEVLGDVGTVTTQSRGAGRYRLSIETEWVPSPAAQAIIRESFSSFSTRPEIQYASGSIDISVYALDLDPALNRNWELVALAIRNARRLDVR